MILLFGPCQPRDPVGQWLKMTGMCDTVHQVIHKCGNELRTGCQQTMNAQQAIRPALGARFCEVCWSNMVAREKHVRTCGNKR
jgi:hypothetical protein